MSMQYFTQVDCSLIFHCYGLHYNTRSKMFNEEIILRYTVQEEDTQYSTQVFVVHIILHGYGLQYNTRSKRDNKEIILCFTV